MVTQNSAPLVSVIVPIFNGARYIIECLNSIVKQKYSNLEIIVVDDGSADESVKLVESFIRQHPQKKIKLISQANGGSSAARNKGLNHSNGTYVAFLDADDFWFPNKINEHISKMYLTGDKVVGSLMNYTNSNSRIFGICGEDPSERQSEIRTGKFMPAVLSSFIFESKLVKSLQGFDEQLRFSQDLELLARCAQISEVKVLNRLLGCYRLHGASISTVNGLEQEKSYEYIKLKFADYPNKSKDLKFNDFVQVYRPKMSRDRIAAIHFRNFGVQTMNGKIYLGLAQLLRAIKCSPVYVSKRIVLRLGNAIVWKIRLKRHT